MAEERVQRRLAAILAADVVGYSRLMGADEEATLRTLKGHREIIDGLIVRYDGRVFGTAGDSIMAEFSSAVEAVRAATAIQEELGARNAEFPSEGRMMFRIGVNLGDIMVEGDNLYGDGVNVAARLEGIAEPGGICISGNAFDQVKNKNLPVSFTDMGPQTVKNIAEPVHAYAVRKMDENSAPPPQAAETLPFPEKPSIAVLPFENMSGDAEQEYFSDGISEDIITELSKISGLFVIARNSSFVYKGKPISVKQVGRDLGVRYVLEGSVRKAGNRLRITAQLIDAPTDHHVWVERFDRELEDIFAVQDEVARRVAEELEVTLTPAESGRLGRAPTDNLEAYDNYLRARSIQFPRTRHNIAASRAAFQKVIELDPTFAGGYAGESMMHSLAVLFRYSENPEEDKEIALKLAQRALELDPEFPGSQSAVAIAYSALGEHEKAIAAARYAVERQPGDAHAHHTLSRCLRVAGLYDDACEEGYAALRLDPEGPWLNNLGRTTFLAGRYQEAVDAYERNAARGGPSYLGQLLIRAAACSLAGEHAKARELVHQMLQERPNLSLKKIGEIRSDLIESEVEPMREALRKAGLPE